MSAMMNQAAPGLKRLLLVYHSRTGASEQMAHAVARGARQESGVLTQLCRAADTMAEDVLAADGYVFIGPENLAAISGEMKEFFDRCYYPVLERINGRPYAVVVCAGSDGQNAVRQMERIATGWRLRAIAAPIIVCTRAQSTEQILAAKTVAAAELARGEELGAALTAGLAAGIF